MGVVYKITNKINWKFYIGSTTRTINERLRHHKYCSKDINTKNLLYKDIQKYWWRDNFKVDILYQTDDWKELANKEEELLKELVPPYNSLIKVYKYTLKNNSYKWSKHHNFNKAAENRKRIYNYTLDKIYESWAEAESALRLSLFWRKINHNNTNIARCCRWVELLWGCEIRYIDDDWNIINPYSRVRKKRTSWYLIKCLNTGKVGLIKDFEWNPHLIRKVCTYTIPSYKGDVYRYLDKNGNVLTERDLYDFIPFNKTKVLSSIESKCLAMTKCEDKETLVENANKPAETVATQRDYWAWEMSKNITKKTMPKKILDAWDNNYIRWHDADFSALPQINCCLCDLKWMFENGTVLNGKQIIEPKSLKTAATLMTQISMTLTGGQYWGQTFDISHLAKYVKVSYNKIYDKINEELPNILEEDKIKLAKRELSDEIKDSIQTIQYQLITMKATWGQSPFVTLWMQIYDDYYPQETAMLIEEILKQRLKGIPNAQWLNMTVAFPKLIYVLDENNVHKDSPYYYLTELSAKCTAKRIYPDYISAKKQREIHNGNTVPVMWCRNMLNDWVWEDWKYKYYGRFNAGVVTINFVKLAFESNGSLTKFRELFDQYTDILKDALLYKHWLLKWVKAKSSPIHWQYWALTRLNAEDVIDPYLYWWYCSVWAGFIWLYETVKLLTWESNTKNNLAYEILSKFRTKCDKRTEEYNIAFGCYATPAESLCKTFHDKDKKVYWEVKDITDKGYYTNWFMVDWREPISAFDKLSYESKFQPLAKSGCISYIETSNLEKNPEAVLTVIKYIYNNIIYAGINRQANICHKCNFDWDINVINWRRSCPQCWNTDRNQMTITVRVCWYLSETQFNQWKEAEIEIRERVLHL